MTYIRDGIPFEADGRAPQWQTREYPIFDFDLDIAPGDGSNLDQPHRRRSHRTDWSDHPDSSVRPHA